MSQSAKEWCRIVIAIVAVVAMLQGLRLWTDTWDPCEPFVRGFRLGMGIHPGPACK